MPGVCEVHGPYDGSACPYPPPHSEAARGRPMRPHPLADDDLATELSGRNEDMATGPTATGGGGSAGNGSEAETAISGRHGRHDLDMEEGEPTVIEKEAVDVTLPPPDRVSRPTTALLWVKEGGRPGKIYPLKDGTVIGRQWEKEGDLVLDERGVSARHAKFKVEDDEFVVWDMGSSYGTFVNGRQIREATVLEENDLMKIGETTFVVKLLEAKVRRTRNAPRAPRRKATRKARK